VSINLICQGKYNEALGRISGSQSFMPSLWAYQTSFALSARSPDEAAILRDTEHDDKTDTAALLRSMEAVLAAGEGDRKLADEKIAEAIKLDSGFSPFITRSDLSTVRKLHQLHYEAEPYRSSPAVQ
jgi:hypothetical protein